MKSLEGYLLVANPYVEHPELAESVILVVQHAEGGILGVQLNHPDNSRLQSLWQNSGATVHPQVGSVGVGGSVPGSLLAVHGAGKDGFHTSRFASSNSANAKKTRLFVGHSSWSNSELAEELESGVWMLIPAREEHVFGEAAELWSHVVRELGRNVVAETLGRDTTTVDPTLN